MVESYRYDAWGRVDGIFDSEGAALSESALGNRYLWQGREYSWKAGLYYFRARWYDPVMGRWLCKDPIGISGGLNQYVFCLNSPVNYVDHTGRAPQLVSVSLDMTTGRMTSGYGPHRDLGSFDPLRGGIGCRAKNGEACPKDGPPRNPYFDAYLRGWISGYIPFPTAMTPGEVVPWAVQPWISPRPNPYDYLIPNPMASPIRAWQSALDEVGRQIEASPDPVQGWLWFARRMCGP